MIFGNHNYVIQSEVKGDKFFFIEKFRNSQVYNLNSLILSIVGFYIWTYNS